MLCYAQVDPDIIDPDEPEAAAAAPTDRRPSWSRRQAVGGSRHFWALCVASWANTMFFTGFNIA